MVMPRHDKHFLFFGNKKSGDGRASQILSERKGEFMISIENERIFGETFDIFMDDQFLQGMTKLKSLALYSKEKGAEAQDWPVAIVFGGDGSYMKILKNFAEHGIDLNFITCCFLPFGTGNDLPR